MIIYGQKPWKHRSKEEKSIITELTESWNKTCYLIQVWKEEENDYKIRCGSVDNNGICSKLDCPRFIGLTDNIPPKDKSDIYLT